ncbi:PEPxxWA-CTERM sorting domain-containing protein [Allopontixanthobacter sediminis]|uniref:PEPxxWA-CTERM sorting domain-containing protein n=1 Tax=Allopontixanthobacter sediminis TaxID=1689985 RepID=A0A845B2F7_9SPHN|nr:PEPxxWA-CTERM sorting domain-containing protein [Allopontixanthobacter sediminis]MXP44600.1 PEPxxWA-CTERM sorting domain-containing protein [Allopontixanthobacter sediminis]
MNAIACIEASGNLNNDSPEANAARTALWGSIGGGSIGQSSWIAGNKLEFAGDFRGQTFSFTAPLSGISFLAIHWGGGSTHDGGPGNSTVFYKIDAGTGPMTFTTNFRGISNAALYSTSGPAVPEPATWAMFILGLGLVGFTLRRRKTHSSRFAFS